MMTAFLTDFLELFYPVLCVACGRKLVQQEKFLCLHCLHDLPRTNFHTIPENKVAQIFWGRVPVEMASSWLYFRKGSRYQRLVHFLKYKGIKEIGEEMGRLYGIDLQGSSYATADILVPVPLHPRRLKERGYNQSEWLARGIAESLNIPVSTGNLVRGKFTSTQTRKNRFERFRNVEGIFTVLKPEELLHKHVLLVDDVVTTGSTLESSAEALLAAGAGKVSIATLACAEI